mmetsp:Transcript_2556/g.9888  ORF Transcript_2556/g.9888 Transcript_2556/m.9888 type:complete len:205 (+) Transcript_2556:2874-3488(+)
MRAFVIPAPIPATSSSNLSTLPRQKLSAALSKFLAPLAFPNSPKSSIQTLASVPAPLVSVVVTVTKNFWSTNACAALCFRSSCSEGRSVQCVSPPRCLSSHTPRGNKVVSHPFVMLLKLTLCRSHPGESPESLCPIFKCVRVPISLAVTLNTSTPPREKLSGALSSTVSRMTKVRPSAASPNALNTTAASVEAPFASPVVTVTR